jgi:ubiquitin carboxyl-terminal hydrolase 25
MDKQISELSQAIEKAYSQMNTTPYYLHAICIHDGNAYSGHYYALLFDRFNQKWRKFNDIRVSDLTEEEVFKEANGGHGHMTAYWVVYVNEEVAKQMSKSDIYSYKPS